MLVSAVVLPYLIIPAIVLTLLVVPIRGAYIRTARDLRRLDAISMSLLFIKAFCSNLLFFITNLLLQPKVHYTVTLRLVSKDSPQFEPLDLSIGSKNNSKTIFATRTQVALPPQWHHELWPLHWTCSHVSTSSSSVPCLSHVLKVTPNL